MPWDDFIGNRIAVERLQHLAVAGLAASGPFPATVLAGPQGVGKTTLAFGLGLALNCLLPPSPGAFCGRCASCASAVPVAEWPALQEAALAHRAAEVKSGAREAAPLVLAPHPAVRVYPPDGDFLSLPQARAAIHQSQLQPDARRFWTLILPDLDSARWATQTALLKTLEEPPPRVALVVLARNSLALLPTVRSRALVINLAPNAISELAPALAGRLNLPMPQAELATRLAQGCPGRALTLDLAEYRLRRRDALALLQAGVSPNGQADTLFRLTESTRANKEKFETLLEILYSILQDIVVLQSGFSDAVRNVDSVPELTLLARQLSPTALPRIVEELDRVQSAARRNAFRPLALASWALSIVPASTETR